MSVFTDLIAEPIDTSMGVALGYSDYRFVVQAAITSTGSPLGTVPGSFILGTSTLGGPRWRDITGYFQGISFSSGGTPGDRPIAGELKIRLNNEGREFSPYRSPYYAPGTLFRIVVGNDSDLHHVFTGLVQSWNESSEGLRAYQWVDIVVWESMYQLGMVDDLELSSVVGVGETLVQRLDRLVTAASWQFGSEVVGTEPSLSWQYQGTLLAQDILSEMYLTADSIDYQVIPGKDGSIRVVDREIEWVDVAYRVLGTDVATVADSLITQNDDVRLLSDITLGAVGGTPLVYTNSGIASRYQKRSQHRTDLITQDPGANEDLDKVAAGILGRGDTTYRPMSVQLDTQHGDPVWQFVLFADIGNLCHIDDEDSGVRFSSYPICGMDHAIEVMNTGAVHWTCTTHFDIESSSTWAVRNTDSRWGTATWGSSTWTT